MEHVLALDFLSLLPKGKRPKDEPIVPGKANEVFHIHELVENILSYLPALDLLVLQMVKPTCNRVVSIFKSFQEKLFMMPDPSISGAAIQESEKFSANEFSWNPFLMHYGTPIPPQPGSCSPPQRVTIKRKYVRKEKFDRPDTSWKKIFLAHPTNLDFRAQVEARAFLGFHNCNYGSRDVGKGTQVLTMGFFDGG